MKQLRRNQKKCFSVEMLIRQHFEDSTIFGGDFLNAGLSYLITQESTTLRVLKYPVDLPPCYGPYFDDFMTQNGSLRG